ncbi:MAG: flavodoxin-dependent (E)-4-hydroxy-3-methylbut-2-enyl-diphosphate synthase, partial [Candidatus Diapherotrites archaeon]|nr:flavodoxin-dependent (E)-4-hydroxy-3-methylbut-2-enyl-diphosphate synthase [Candidatus Diapherotrites archaeon]
MERRKTREVRIGDVKIGKNNPIAVQSMCNTYTRDVDATVKQILELEEVGCEIIRVAVPTMEDAKALKEIRKQIHIPLVADIHFDYRLAVASAPYVDKLRINPGNIGSKEKIKAVVDAAKEYGLAIRVGVNSGSIEQDLLQKYGNTVEALVESALRNVKILEEFDFQDIVISAKASDVIKTIRTYEKISEKTDYPLHLGVTEAGTKFSGTVKSAIGIGALLAEGIGDTIRVSLTAPVVEEVRVAWEILKDLGLRERGPIVISCPTCGRTEIDVFSLAEKVEKAVQNIEKPLRIAVMGCVVNGVGEGKEADIGIAGGKHEGVIFKKGKVIKKVPEEK